MTPPPSPPPKNEYSQSWYTIYGVLGVFNIRGGGGLILAGEDYKECGTTTATHRYFGLMPTPPSQIRPRNNLTKGVVGLSQVDFGGS